MATWPATLPSPMVNGYKVTPVDTVIRTDMEGGNTKTRRRSNARNDKLAFQMAFTDAEMAIFRAWFDSSTGANGGASWFTISLRTGDGGRLSVEARYSGVWSEGSFDGRNWIVPMALEVRYA